MKNIPLTKEVLLSSIREGKDPLRLSLSDFQRLGMEVELKSAPFSILSKEECLLLLSFEFARDESIDLSQISYLRNLARKKNAYAQYLLGEGYRKGIGGLRMNLKLALSFHKKAYRNGFWDSGAVLFLLDGLSKEERKKFLQNLPQLEEDRHVLELVGESYLLGGKTKEGQEMLEKCLSSGSRTPLRLLVLSYLQGPRKSRNYPRALELSLLGEKMGIMEMSLIAGDAYFLARGAKRDFEKARSHYLLVQENSYALKRLGDIERSYGHAENAISYYKKAIEKDEDSAWIPYLFLMSHKSKEKEEQEKCLLQLEERAKDKKDLYYPLGQLAHRLGFSKLGKKYFREAIEKEDKRALREAFLKKKETKLAKKVFLSGRKRGKFLAIARDFPPAKC